VADSSVWGRLTDLYSRANNRAVIIAPFIKVPLFEEILSVIPAAVNDIVCVTRWSASEVAAGVSDPEIVDIARSDGRPTIWLCHNLHAKLYVADEALLIGSANLTKKGVGKLAESNIEILTSGHIGDPAITGAWEDAIAQSVPATIETARSVRKLADRMLARGVNVMPAEIVSSNAGRRWFPGSRVPAQLFAAHHGDLSKVPYIAHEDVLIDLAHLDLPPSLDRDQFNNAVKRRLHSIPELADLLKNGKMTSAELEAALRSACMDNGQDPKIVTDSLVRWLIYFDDEFQQVPTGDYEVRRAKDLT